jgi:hypothetical protein
MINFKKASPKIFAVIGAALRSEQFDPTLRETADIMKEGWKRGLNPKDGCPRTMR